MLGAHGICPRQAALESPEQIGKTERKGDVWKMNAKRVINDRQINSEHQMRMLAAELSAETNDSTRWIQLFTVGAGGISWKMP